MNYNQIMSQKNDNLYFGNGFNDASEVWQMILRYEDNPGAFTPEQIRKLQEAANHFMLPFRVKDDVSRIAKNFLYNLADSVTLGLLPSSWEPDTVTDAEKIAGTLGDVLGFVVPLGVAKTGASAIMKAVKGGKVPFANLLTKATKATNLKATDKLGALRKAMIKNDKLTEQILTGALAGGGHDILGGEIDPTGALIGGSIPFVWAGGLNKAKNSFNKYINSLDKTPIGRAVKNRSVKNTPVKDVPVEEVSIVRTATPTVTYTGQTATPTVTSTASRTVSRPQTVLDSEDFTKIPSNAPESFTGINTSGKGLVNELLANPTIARKHDIFLTKIEGLPIDQGDRLMEEMLISYNKNGIYGLNEFLDNILKNMG